MLPKFGMQGCGTARLQGTATVAQRTAHVIVVTDTGTCQRGGAGGRLVVWVDRQTFLTLGIGLGLGFWIGPDQEFYLMGVAVTLGLIFIYSAGNVGVYLYYRSEREDEFNPWFHLIFPLLSTGALIWVGYKSVVPLPPPPVGYAPILAGAWFLVGVVVWILKRTRFNGSEGQLGPQGER